MSYAAKTWTVMKVSPDANFDLLPEDVLDFTTNPVKRRRNGSSIDWGMTIKYTEDQGQPQIFGRHDASTQLDSFEILITPGSPATHTGKLKGPGTGSRGTWEAQEGG